MLFLPWILADPSANYMKIKIIYAAGFDKFYPVHSFFSINKLSFGFIEFFDPFIITFIQLLRCQIFHFVCKDEVKICFTICSFIKNDKRTRFEPVIDLLICISEVLHIIEISFVYCNSDRNIDRTCKFTYPDGYLFLVGSMISTISVFSQFTFIAIQNQACPIEIDISMLKIISLE